MDAEAEEAFVFPDDELAWLKNEVAEQVAENEVCGQKSHY